MSLQILFRWLSALCLNLMLAMYLVNGPDAQARIIRVSQSGDNTDGNSWATAYRTVSAAYNNAVGKDRIWVCSGTYDDNVLIEKDISILGGFSGTENEYEEDLRNPIHNITIMDSQNRNMALFGCVKKCIIDGFILTGSTAPGLLIYNGASPTISRCRIHGNKVDEQGSYGGGVIVSSAYPFFHHCYIYDNIAKDSGAGMKIEEYSTVNISNCTISNNVSYNGSAGGIRCTYSTITMENCVVTNNAAYPDSPEVITSFGGGISIGGEGSIGIFRNCLIANNWSTKWKQLAIGSSSEPYVSFDNCTIIGDLAADAHWRNAPPTMNNCILWGANGILAGEEGEADISYSCIQGGYSGIGNISDDPLFRDPTHGNYRLLPESPCIDTGDTFGPSDDLNGNPRPVDIAGIGREVTDTYDMGAYEVQLNEVPTPTPTQVPSQIDPGNTMLYK